MELFLIRHTTPKVEKGICYGQLDLSLDTEKYPLERSQIQQELPSLENSPQAENSWKLFTSPLQRCAQLAAEFQNYPKTDPRLMELDFGAWEGLKWKDIPQEQLMPWMENFVEQVAPKGESFRDLNRRVMDFYEEMKGFSAERVYLFTHAGPIRCILCQVLGMPLKQAFRIQFPYGKVFKIQFSDANDPGKVIFS